MTAPSAKDPVALTPDEVETIEKLTMRWLYQAVVDFGYTASEIFRNSPDEVKDVAEDITRELLESFSGYRINQRIFGTVDYRKAGYILLPDSAVRQALFVDSKAEQSRSSGTMQMSQLSMDVIQIRDGAEVTEHGKLPPISTYSGTNFLTTTMLIHYFYEDNAQGKHLLKTATLAAVPNGKLQLKYNPDVSDGIWNVGRNAPRRGEDFRVRVAFAKLKAKAGWRVQHVNYSATAPAITTSWEQ